MGRYCKACGKPHLKASQTVLDCNTLKALKNDGCLEAVFMAVLRTHITFAGMDLPSAYHAELRVAAKEINAKFDKQEKDKELEQAKKDANKVGMTLTRECSQALRSTKRARVD